MRLIILLAFVTAFSVGAMAQQPFEKYGYKVQVATLSKGEYQEFFDQDTLVQIGSVVINALTGKITHFVTFDTTYSESNLQPELISRWMSPDPLAEKYYSFSPYTFVANNPILFVDPDGREIWINYGNDQKVKYNNGKLYNEDGSKFKGKDAFVSAAFKTLNTINSTKNGKTVLGELSGSENKFNVNNTFAKDSKGNDIKDVMSFSANKDGGGNIDAGALMNNTDQGQKTENIAHELFHGYQNENGETGATVNREVGAYLFGRSVAIQSGQSYDYSFGNFSNSGAVYNNAMLGVMTGAKFDPKGFQNAVMTFKTGSRANQSGIYNRFNYSLKPPLIQKFYPLTDQ